MDHTFNVVIDNIQSTAPQNQLQSVHQTSLTHILDFCLTYRSANHDLASFKEPQQNALHMF